MPDKNRLGRRLQSLRSEARLSIDDSARETGLTPVDIAAFESGDALPNPQQLDDLATSYGVTVHRLVTGSIEQNKSGKLIAPETHAIHYGIGRNQQEAEEAKREKKLGELPYYDIDMPEDLTFEELEAMIEEYSGSIGNAAILMQSTLRAIRNDVLPKARVDAMRMAVRDILVARRMIDNSFVK